MDQGIWGTWYDLEADARDRFLEWAHRVYLPHLRQLSGVSWVAHYQNTGGGPAMRELGERVSRPEDQVGLGSQCLLLVGAPSPHTFFTPSMLEEEARGEFRDMLSLRKEVRTAIFSEEARLNGPAARDRAPGSTPAAAIQMGTFRMKSPQQDFDLACWYAQYRLPHMAQMEGCVAARKLLCVAGWPKHGILYEFTSLDARMKQFEEPHEALALNPKEWTGRVVSGTVHTPGSPTVGLRIWPPVS